MIIENITETNSGVSINIIARGFPYAPNPNTGNTFSLFKSIPKKLVEIDVTAGKSIPKINDGFVYQSSNTIIDYGTISNNMSPSIQEDYGLVIIKYLQCTSLTNNYIYLISINEFT